MLGDIIADSRATSPGIRNRLVARHLALGFLVWFFGFMIVGGEWYSMWQSPMWNGQEAAFRFYMTILAVLIFVNQSDGDLAARARWSLADDPSEG